MSIFGYDRLRLGEFVGLSTFQYLAYFRRAIFYGFIAVYLGTVLNLSTVEVTLMATFGMIANSGSQALIWGNLLDRFKRSALFIFMGEIIAGIGHIGMYYWHISVLNTGDARAAGYTIIVGLAIIEIFWSQSNVGFSALISELTEEDKRKKLMSQLSIVGGIGGISGATLGGYLYLGGGGFQNGNLFIIPAVVMVVSAIIVYFSIRDPEQRLETYKNTSGPQSEITNQKYSLSDLPKPMIKLYLVLLLSLVFINFGRNSIALISSLYIVDQGAFGASDQQLALFRNVSSGATIVAGIFLGSILSAVEDIKVMYSGIIFALLALLWLLLAPTFELVLLASALIGATHIIIQASSYAIAAAIIPPEYRGRLFSYYNATFFLSWGIGGTLVAAPVADFMINHGYSKALAYQASFISAIIMVIIGLLLFVTFVKKMNDYGNQQNTENILPELTSV